MQKKMFNNQKKRPIKNTNKSICKSMIRIWKLKSKIVYLLSTLRARAQDKIPKYLGKTLETVLKRLKLIYV